MGNWKRLVAVIALAVGGMGGAVGTAHAETTTQFNTDTQPIRVWQSGQPHPGPSGIRVSGVEGSITDVDLYLNVLDSESMKDLHMLLVSPAGESEVVMSHNCSNADVENRFLTFDQSATGVMPNSLHPCSTDAYKPSDNDPATADPFTGLPGGPVYSHNFDNFDNENASGVWWLYAFTDCTSCLGEQLEGGWALRIETGALALDVPGGTAMFGPADPYPQVVNSSKSGFVTDLNVYLNGVFHTEPDDLDMVLERVGGPAVMLMSDACGTYDVNAYGWRFDDEAPAHMPDEGDTNICGTTAHRPTNHHSTLSNNDVMPAPAPAGPYAASLSAFDLTSANGEYRLWVQDDGSGKYEGFFTHKFELEMDTRPAASTSFANSPLEVGEGETGELTIRRSGASAYAAGRVLVASATGTAGEGDFEPITAGVQFEPGETEETIEVRALQDGETEEAEAFTVEMFMPSGDVAPSGEEATVVIPANRDAIAPDTEITKRPPWRTDSSRARFAFSSTEADSTLRCSLDRGRFKRCVSPLTAKGLNPGRHRFRVRATDAAGNTDPTPAIARWRVRG